MSIWHPLSCDDDPRTVAWSSVSIKPHPLWVEYAQDKFRPDISEISDDAIARSRYDAASVDRIGVIVGIINIMIAQAKRDFLESGHPEAIEGIDAIESRDDYSVDMIWDYFTHWGPAGAAVHANVARMLASDDVMNVAIATIQSGRFDEP